MFLCSFHPPLPPIFTLRLYFATLRFRFPLFLHCTGVSSPASPPHSPLLCFNFSPRRKICSPMQQLHVSEREKDKETDSKRKSRRGLWGRLFDVQGMSQYTLSDPLWHFCYASARDPPNYYRILIILLSFTLVLYLFPPLFPPGPDLFISLSVTWASFFCR